MVATSQDIFSNVVSNIKTLAEKSAAQVIDGLAANVTSSNSLINNCGQSLMKKLLLSEDLECAVFVPPMCHQVLQGSTRAKAVILNILSDVVEIIYEVKSIAVTKHVFSL